MGSRLWAIWWLPCRKGTSLAYNSVLTTIRILEQKGYVEHRQDGRAFLYTPCVAEHEASQTEVRHMLQRFFGNSRERLLISLLGDDEITPEELQRLKQAIADAPEDPVAVLCADEEGEDA